MLRETFVRRKFNYVKDILAIKSTSYIFGIVKVSIYYMVCSFIFLKYRIFNFYDLY